MALAGSATRRALPKTELCPSPPVEWAAWGWVYKRTDHGLIECATPTGCPWRRWCSTGLGSSPSRPATLRGHTWRAFWDWLTASIRRSSPRRRRHCPPPSQPKISNATCASSPPRPASPRWHELEVLHPVGRRAGAEGRCLVQRTWRRLRRLPAIHPAPGCWVRLDRPTAAHPRPASAGPRREPGAA